MALKRSLTGVSLDLSSRDLTRLSILNRMTADFRRSAHATDPATATTTMFFEFLSYFFANFGILKLKIRPAREISSKNRQNRSHPRDFSAI